MSSVAPEAAPAPADEDWRAGGFGVYVHWPFCRAKCPYCDFNSHVVDLVDQPRWRAALVAGLEEARALTGPRAADTVFFGGGTPSLMPAETVGAAIEAVDRLWGLAPGAEISLEANPTSVEAAKFRDYGAAGVNRLSMGVQALNDRDLRALGRTHDAAEARAAFDIARAAFARVSFDLIYARQGQTPEAWRAELEAAIAMAVDHLSLYQLTIEPGTRFGELAARGRLRDLPPDEAAAEMYFVTQEATAAAGMPAYEISNHARPGAESRHNLIYWRTGDFVGVGPGAHGRVTVGGRRLATEAVRAPADWLAAVEAGRGPETVPVTAEETAEEHLLMGLRLAEGISLARHRRLGGALPADRLSRLEEGGFVTLDGDRLSATEKGRPVLNAILRELAA